MSARFATNTFYGVLASLSGSLGSFATTVVVARLLGVTDTGVVNFGLWAVTLACAATDLGAYASLTRYLPELTRSQGRAEAEQLVGYLLMPFAAVTAAGLLLFVALAVYAHHDPASAQQFGLGGEPLLWLLVGALYVVQALANFALGYLQGMQRFDVVTVFALSAAAVRLAATALGCYVLGVPGALLGYVAGYALSAPLPFLAGRHGRRAPPALRRRVLRFSAFSWASALTAAFIVARPEIAFLNYFHGKDDIGLYTAAFTLANLAIQGPLSLTAGLVPYFSEHAGTDGRAMLEKMVSSAARILALLILPMAFGTAALAGQLVPLLYGQAFAGASTAAVILIASASLGGNAALCTSLMNGHERSDVSFYLNLSGAILTVAIALALVPEYGIVGAASGRAIVQLYLFVASAWFVTARLDYRLPLARMSRLLAAALGCAFTAAIVVRLVGGVYGIALAVTLGAVVYGLLVRVLGGVERGDVERLGTLLSRLPALVRVPVAALFARLAPSA